MKTRIGFSTPKQFNPVSWLVRKFSGSSASHAFFIYYDQDWSADMVMEAHELGFRLIPLDRFEKKNKIIAIFEPTQSIETGISHVALKYLGTMYDYGGLFGGAILMFGRWFKRSWHNPTESASAVFCSEAIVIALQHAKYAGSESLDAQDVTPQDLLNFLTQQQNGHDTI